MTPYLPTVLRDWWGFSLGSRRVPDLCTTIVVDYQDVHLTSHRRFKSDQERPPTPGTDRPAPLREPTAPGPQRAAARWDAEPVLRTVYVYRRLPSSDHNPRAFARNLAQMAQRERVKRLPSPRPIGYRYWPDAGGRRITNPVRIKVLRGPSAEKDVDVMCAVTVLRHARR